MNYPIVRKGSVVDNYHGTKIADPFRWLEDMSSEEVKDFVRAQNGVTNDFISTCDKRASIQEKLVEMWTYNDFECPFRRGENYYYFNGGTLHRLNSLEEIGHPGQEVLSRSQFPPNSYLSFATSEKTGENVGDYLFSFSNKGDILCYGVSENGSDWKTIHFKNVETGVSYPDLLENVKDKYLSWTWDGKGLFYGGLPNKDTYENHKILYHSLGTSQSDDRIIVQFPENPKCELQANVSDCGNYLVTYVLKDCSGESLVFLGVLEEILASQGQSFPHNFIPVVSEFKGNYDYITNSNSLFYFLTSSHTSPRGKIIRVDVNLIKSRDGGDSWKCVVEEHSKDVLEWAACANQKYLLTCYIHDVRHLLQLRNLEDGSLLQEFPLELGSVVGFSGRWNDTEIFFKFESFLTPGTIYRVNLEKPEKKSGIMTSCQRLLCGLGKLLSQRTREPLFKAQLFRECRPKGFDGSSYKIRQVFYPSKDKTMVSMFLVHQKNIAKDSNNPCLLFGYGGFSKSIEPYFDPTGIVFLKHFGGMLAVANIRGGGEYGEKWHEDGILLRKQNCFDDFHSAAEYLIHKKYTCPKKLSIRGDSNGGLMVAVCVNQRPDLFGCAIARFGVMDMLRFHKFTTGSCWASDYGCSDNKEDFNNLVKYSPLHNVKLPQSDKSVQYPAVLLIAGDHDEIVLPLHSYKLIAQLQATIGHNSRQTNPLLIRVETNVGHGGGMTFERSVFN